MTEEQKAKIKTVQERCVILDRKEELDCIDLLLDEIENLKSDYEKLRERFAFYVRETGVNPNEI